MARLYAYADPLGGGPGRLVAYNPLNDTWEVLAPSALSQRDGPFLAWTGKEIVVWGGSGQLLTDGAFYSP